MARVVKGLIREFGPARGITSVETLSAKTEIPYGTLRKRMDARLSFDYDQMLAVATSLGVDLGEMIARAEALRRSLLGDSEPSPVLPRNEPAAGSEDLAGDKPGSAETPEDRYRRLMAEADEFERRSDPPGQRGGFQFRLATWGRSGPARQRVSAYLPAVLRVGDGCREVGAAERRDVGPRNLRGGCGVVGRVASRAGRAEARGMSRGARIGLFLAAGVLLAGCSGAKADLSAAPVVTESSASSVPDRLTDADYLRLVRELPYIAASVTDEVLLRMADTVCGLLSGESIHGPISDPVTFLPWKRAIDVMTESGFPAQQAGSFLVYATAYVCPEKQATYLPPS
jgi:hypothetical protein